MINVYMCRDTMRQSMNLCSRVETLGRQLGLDTEQIKAILTTDHHENEHVSFSLGPMYSGSYYGTISIKDFTAVP
jgi:hypothetical protein